MIKCKFQLRQEFGQILKNTNGKQRMGRYHSSYFHDVKEFGKKKWIIVANIDILEENCKLEEYNIGLITEECLDFLNQPPIRKRKTKRKPKPPYGNLSLYKAFVRKKKDKCYIQVLLITDEKKNKHFWGSGPSILLRSKKK